MKKVFMTAPEPAVMGFPPALKSVALTGTKAAMYEHNALMALSTVVKQPSIIEKEHTIRKSVLVT